MCGSQAGLYAATDYLLNNPHFNGPSPAAVGLEANKTISCERLRCHWERMFFEISYILANTQIQGSPSLKKTTLYILFVAIVLKFDSSRSIPTALRMVLIRTEGQGI